MTISPDTPNAGPTPINRMVPPTPMDDAKTAEAVERIFFELRKVIVGQTRLLERMLVGLLARRGHDQGRLVGMSSGVVPWIHADDRSEMTPGR